MRSTISSTARIAALHAFLVHVGKVLTHRRRIRDRGRRAIERFEADEITVERFASWATRTAMDDFSRSNALASELALQTQGVEALPAGIRLTRAEIAVLQPVWTRLRKRLQASRAESLHLQERLIRATFGPEDVDELRDFRALVRDFDRGQYRERLPETVSWSAIRALMHHFIIEECMRAELSRLALEASGALGRS